MDIADAQLESRLYWTQQGLSETTLYFGKILDVEDGSQGLM